MRPTLIIMAAAIALPSLPTFAQDQPPVLESHADGEIRSLGLRIDAAISDEDPPVLWREDLTTTGADYVRLLLRHEGTEFPADSRLIILPGFGPEQQILLAEIGDEGLWTGAIHSGQATLALESSELLGGAVLILDSIAVEMQAGVSYSPHRRNDLRPINADDVPSALRARAPSVAALYLIDRGRPTRCTGVLIEPDLLLTNEHCVNSAALCRSMDIVFGYEIDDRGRMQLGERRSCAGFEPDLVNYELDAAFVQLNSPAGDSFPPVPLATADPQGNLHIIQHPSGELKQISFTDCAAAQTRIAGRGEGTDFSHTCDTAGGSSGAPVFDTEGRLVGLHHFGFDDSQPGGWSENRAVHADLIAGWRRGDAVNRPGFTGE